MHVVTWGPFRLRVWVDELPDIEYEIAWWREATAPARIAERPTPRQLAIEMAMFVPERFPYGALGGTLSPTPGSEELRIELAVPTTWRGAIWWEGEPYDRDEPRKGFVPGFAGELLMTVAERARTSCLPGGTLSLTHSVMGEIGGSTYVHRDIAYMLVALWSLEDWPPDQETIRRETYRAVKGHYPDNLTGNLPTGTGSPPQWSGGNDAVERHEH